MLTQFKFFRQDVIKTIGKNKVRIIIFIFSRQFWGLLIYRMERSLFLLFGKYYKYIRLPFVPIINVLQAYSNIDIHYRADIKGGVSVLHPSCGVVVSGYSTIGSNLTLTGGNIIGIKDSNKSKEFVIGDNCFLGANSVILGPVKLANQISIGASACVVKDCFENNCSLIGVPALINKSNGI